jgi:hypothetical protein
MKLFILLGLLAILIAPGSVSADDNDVPEPPHTPEVREAMKEFDSNVRNARIDFDKSVRAALDDYVKKLDDILKTTMKKGDLEESNRINAFKAAATQRASDVAESRVSVAPPPPPPTALGPLPKVIPLTAVSPLHAEVGNGAFMLGRKPGAKPLKLKGGATFDFIFAHATSQLIYEVPPGYRKFAAIGTTADRGDKRAQHFRFIIKTEDGNVLLMTNELVSYPDAEVSIEINIPPNTKTLELVTESMWDHGMQWSIWALPRFTK